MSANEEAVEFFAFTSTDFPPHREFLAACTPKPPKAVIHYRHDQSQRCNECCAFYFHGERITQTSRPVGLPWSYKPGEYTKAMFGETQPEEDSRFENFTTSYQTLQKMKEIAAAEQRTKALHFHHSGESCNCSCRQFIEGREVKVFESKQRNDGLIEYFLARKSASIAAEKNVQARRLDAAIHLRHEENEHCNYNCAFYSKGERFFPNSPTLSYACWIQNPDHYPPGGYVEAAFRQYKTETQHHAKQAHLTNRMQTAFEQNSTSYRQCVTPDDREESSMQASYNVAKLLEALEAKKNSIEEAASEEAEFFKEQFAVKVDEAIAIGDVPHYIRLLEDIANEAETQFQLPDRSEAKKLDRSIAKLKLVDTESVTLNDEEYSKLGLE